MELNSTADIYPYLLSRIQNFSMPLSAKILLVIGIISLASGVYINIKKLLYGDQILIVDFDDLLVYAGIAMMVAAILLTFR